MFGPNGSKDALYTWVLVMLVLGLLGVGGGVLAYTGRWRRWYRPEPSPIQYWPLILAPFGVGCMVELFNLVAHPAGVLLQVLTALPIVGFGLTCLLFLAFPYWLVPPWVRRTDRLPARPRRTGDA